MLKKIFKMFLLCDNQTPFFRRGFPKKRRKKKMKENMKRTTSMKIERCQGSLLLQKLKVMFFLDAHPGNVESLTITRQAIEKRKGKM
ncbi:Hypothetical protein NTJ_14270 [Nesidiocoris tenuis]|uniref:Uncharacterized protein n=1 Tax=Nesidiocoris tenuis TaxID=355587 RepID=A0ABN7BB10_9HEMI|nr:Hypothetical protein NTJ_14270 [Nesidiocoris tenuis]